MPKEKCACMQKGHKVLAAPRGRRLGAASNEHAGAQKPTPRPVEHYEPCDARA